MQDSEAISSSTPETPNVAPAGAAIDRGAQLRKKRRALGALLLLSYAMGYCLPFVARSPDATMLVILPFSIIEQSFIIYWFVLDAQERDFKITKGLFGMFFALSLVAAPYYFIRTRRRKAAAPILYALLFLLSMGAADALGTWAGEQTPRLLKSIRIGNGE